MAKEVGERSPYNYVIGGARLARPTNNVRKSFARDELESGWNVQKILCLDLGTKTGWAVLSDGNITSGTETFKSDRFQGGGMRFLRFAKWLEEIQTLTDGFSAVYFEEVRRHVGVDAAHCYGGFLAHLTAFCEKYNTPYQGIPVGTIKKHATGKGNACKGMMIQAAIDKGFNPIDDNEADAIAIACMFAGDNSS